MLQTKIKFKINRAFIGLAILLAAIFSLNAEDRSDKSTLKTEKGIEMLSPDLRVLLSQEMQALQKGIISMIPELVSGNYEEVAKTATKIQNSFILEQKLTKEQKDELQQRLPAAFVEIDEGFHKDAGMLAEVAKDKNGELANFYFSKMINACTNCHSRFARDRFSAFRDKKEESGHKH